MQMLRPVFSNTGFVNTHVQVGARGPLRQTDSTQKCVKRIFELNRPRDQRNNAPFLPIPTRRHWREWRTPTDLAVLLYIKRVRPLGRIIRLHPTQSDLSASKFPMINPASQEK